MYQPRSSRYRERTRSSIPSGAHLPQRNNQHNHHNQQHQTRYRKGRQRPTQGHPAMTEMDIRMLQLRKTFKNVSLSYLNVQTQENFLSGCLLHKVIPRVLRIRLRCMAPRKDLSEVQRKFDNHLSDSEIGFTTILRDHHLQASESLQLLLHNSLREMSTVINRASPSELINHQRFQSATESTSKRSPDGGGTWPPESCKDCAEDQPEKIRKKDSH